jgi:hypothetical protein
VEEREEGVSGSRAAGLPDWLLPCWAGSSRVGPVTAFSLLFFFVLKPFHFCFSFSFISFAKMLQIGSNHFQEFSKIQGIKVG